jgi:nucleotide sugar dehydrogenase
MQENVVVVGLGEVGLALAVALARRDCRVTGYDIDQKMVAELRHNRTRHLAPDLDAALKEAVRIGALLFKTALHSAPENRAYVIAVPTPARGSSFDDRPLLAAVKAVQSVARPGDLIVVKSTVPIGTTRSIGRELRVGGIDLDIAYCPDRSVGGNAFAEQFAIPHLIGGLDARSSQRAAQLLGRLGTVINVANPEAAEAAKLFANAQRNVVFGLANEFALICENLGLDMYEIARVAAIDYPRGHLHRPGPVGGPCLAKDVLLLASSVAPANAPLLSLAARAVNERVIAQAAQTIARHLENAGQASRTVAVLGIAFKGIPVTDDVRGSMALELMAMLKQKLPGLAFRGWDAAVAPDTLASLGFLPCDDILAAAADASVVVIANDHAEFRRLVIADMAAVMRKPALIYDLCGTAPRPAELPAGVSVRTFGVGAAGT